MHIFVIYVLVFFLFKHKTAYEMRISDWSSDVCSSDLLPGREGLGVGAAEALGGLREQKFGCALGVGNDLRIPEADDAPAHAFQIGGPFRVIGFQIGRESCRARVCQYV